MVIGTEMCFFKLIIKIILDSPETDLSVQHSGGNISLIYRTTFFMTILKYLTKDFNLQRNRRAMAYR